MLVWSTSRKQIDDRPELAKAFAACRAHRAKLVIAKLDRLSRDVHFLTGLQKAGVQFVAADMPEANEMVVQMMAVVAQAERKMISARTKAALAAAKARGVKLGGDRGGRAPASARVAGTAALIARAQSRADDLAPIVHEFREAGITSLRGIAKGFAERGIEAPRGGGEWTATQVKRLLARVGL